MKSHRMLMLALAGVSTSWFTLASCAASNDDTGSNGGAHPDGAAGGDGKAGSGGKGGTAGKGGSGGTTGGSGGSAATGGSAASGGVQSDALPDVDFNYDAPGSDGFEACAKTVVVAQPSPLDMYIMLDKSGSMTELTAAGPSKWDAIKSALTGFLQNSQSNGIGVGIQYFPIPKAGVPASCTSNAQCGTSGPCLLKTCLKPGTKTITPCSVNSDCGNGPTAQCVDLGYCSGDPSTYCAPVGSTACGTAGSCVKLTTSSCLNADSCTAGDYATPAVPIAVLPGVANTIITNIGQQTPQGQTPTAPAVQGAVNYASSYATQNPSHTVVVVLATDGLPTECTPTDINSIATIAASGVSATPSIKTFVIGVFAKTDTTSQTNLNILANGGGTGTAFIVDPTTGSLSSQFTAALQAIQGQTLGCDFQMPTSPTGIVDPTKVELTLNSATIPHVSGAASCAGDGWYYDNNTTPTKLILCPTTCSSVKSNPADVVDVSLGCQGA